METFAVGLKKVALYMFGLGFIALTQFFFFFLPPGAKSCSEYFETVNHFTKQLLKLIQSFASPIATDLYNTIFI